MNLGYTNSLVSNLDHKYDILHNYAPEYILKFLIIVI